MSPEITAPALGMPWSRLATVQWGVDLSCTNGCSLLWDPEAVGEWLGAGVGRGEGRDRSSVGLGREA